MSAARRATIGLPMMDMPSPNYGPRRNGAPIDILLLHYTGMQTGIAAIERLCDPEAQVSSHYLVEEDGTIYRLVAEGYRAQHAGAGFWAGERDINSRSIGIEIVNPGHEFGYRAFPQAQIDAVLALGLYIVARHPIPPERVLGHSDTAPTRKQDPGELFPWQFLADNGLGIWPSPQEIAPDESIGTLLSRYGYETGEDATTQASLIAFQRHFRPGQIDGVADEECRVLLDALCRQAGDLEVYT